MITHFRSLPAGHYPPDGCALLVRDAWQLLYQLEDLPIHANQFVTANEAGELMQGYQGQVLEPIAQPEHGCMVVASRGEHWHCGVYSTEQAPGYVIHTLGRTIKIEPLNQFRRRFDAVEYYRHASYRPISSSDQKG